MSVSHSGSGNPEGRREHISYDEDEAEGLTADCKAAGIELRIDLE